jgi:hypothetical protein
MTSADPQLSSEPIRLHFTDQTRVVVTPEDEDRFTTTAAEAVRACKNAQEVLSWREEFEKFLTHVYGWCRTRETIAKAYLAFSDEGLELFILTRGSEYRFDLDDDISELDLDLGKGFKKCPTEITQLPETPVRSLHAFFDPGSALEIYGG